jgi:hypothetical protein
LENTVSVPLSVSSSSARPCARRSAVSNDSARRWRDSGRTFRRSITTSIECLSFFASRGRLSTSTTAPSTRKRTKPCVCRSSNRSAKLPLRCCTTGASTSTRESAGRASVMSTICETLCAASACSG